MWNYHTVLQQENLWTRKFSVSFAMHGTQSRGFYLRISRTVLHIWLIVSVWKIHCLSCFKSFSTGLLSELKLPLVIRLSLFSNMFKFLSFSYCNIHKSTTSISLGQLLHMKLISSRGKSKGSWRRTHQPDLRNTRRPRWLQGSEGKEGSIVGAEVPKESARHWLVCVLNASVGTTGSCQGRG